MAAYTDLGATGQEYILEEQYKALFGYPNGKVNSSLNLEVPGTSRPFILQNQLYAQEIPTTAPADLGDTGSTSIGGVGGVHYQRSTTYPYLIKYYDAPLKPVTTYNTSVGALTWWFQEAGATGVTGQKQVEYNILNQGVPNNLDPSGGYVPILNINGTPRAFGNAQYPWTYNVNSGIVLFTGGSSIGTTNITPGSTATIKMTFWRYEGAIGITGSTGSTGDSYWEATTTPINGIQYGALSVETESNNTGSIYTQNIKAKYAAANVNLYTNLETGSLTIGYTGSTSTFNSALVVGGTAKFNNYAPECGVTATSGNQLVNKSFVDNNFVDKTTEQYIAGNKTFGNTITFAGGGVGNNSIVSNYGLKVDGIATFGGTATFNSDLYSSNLQAINTTGQNNLYTNLINNGTTKGTLNIGAYDTFCQINSDTKLRSSVRIYDGATDNSGQIFTKTGNFQISNLCYENIQLPDRSISFGITNTPVNTYNGSIVAICKMTLDDTKFYTKLSSSNLQAIDSAVTQSLYTNLTTGSLNIGSTGTNSTFNSALVVGETGTFKKGLIVGVNGNTGLNLEVLQQAYFYNVNETYNNDYGRILNAGEAMLYHAYSPNNNYSTSHRFYSALNGLEAGKFKSFETGAAVTSVYNNFEVATINAGITGSTGTQSLYTDLTTGSLNIGSTTSTCSINSKTTFTQIPECGVTATSGNQLTNKTYVDNAVSGGSILASDNQWTGKNTFNVQTTFGGTATFNSALVAGGTATFNNYVPECSRGATSGNQLTNKTYVDSKTYQVLNFSPTEVSNIKKSIIYRNAATITSTSITAKLDNAPTTQQVYTFGKKNANLWFAGGEDSTRIYDSSNGINWTRTTLLTFLSTVNCITYSMGRWVAGGANTIHSSFWSDDGTTWNTGADASLINPINDIATNGHIWVAVGQSNGNNKIIYSQGGGQSWVSAGSTVFSTAGYGVASNRKMWVAVGAGGNTIAYSTTGTSNWTASATNIFGNGQGNGVAWNGSMWVAVGKGNNNEMAYSADGITWIANGNPFNTGQGGFCVAWNGKLWVAGGGGNNSSAIINSYNGINWTSANSPMFNGGSNTKYVKSIKWSGSMWVAVGNTNDSSISNIAYSLDGVGWSSANNSNTAATIFNGVAFNSGYGNKITFDNANGVISPSTFSINLNSGEELDVVCDSTYDTGFTNCSISIDN
jgi:hypothetical protein